MRLLDRNPRGIRPTIYGDALLRRGLVVFDELKQGIKEIECLANPGTGEVRIGCPEFLADGVVPAFIDQFVAHCCQAGLRRMPAMVNLLRLDVHLAHFLVAKISSRVAVAYFLRHIYVVALAARSSNK